MKITEEDLSKMIRNGLHKAFSGNGNVDATENFLSLVNMKNMVETDEEIDETKGYSKFLKSKKNPKGETDGLTTDVLNQILMNIVNDMDDEEGGETTEAMGAGASGAYSAPLFSEPKKNTLFQPGTESKLTTKPKGGFVKEQDEVSDEEPITDDITSQYDFNRGDYEPETKSYVGAYMIGEETPKQTAVYNIRQYPDRDAIFVSNHVPYSMSLHKVMLPTSQIEILEDVPGKEGFKFIRMPYWFFKKNQDDLRIQRMDEKRALYLKGWHRKPEQLEKLSDPMFEKYFEQIAYDDVDQRKYNVARDNYQLQKSKLNEDEIQGGKADGMDIEDIAKMHNMTVDDIFGEFQKGVRHEMEHTSEMMVAIEIALDHLYEDAEYYTKLESIEKGGETTEATSSSSVGAYDAPFGGPKKDPLKLSNPDTVEKELRSVRDKNFPKYGGPGAKFVKIKSKCKKFPYCNQGDINALQLFERDIVKEMVTNTAKEAKVEEYVIRNIIAKELGFIREQQDGEYEITTFEFPDDYKPKSAEDHKKEFLDAIPDKRARFLITKYEGKEFEFNSNGLTGKAKISSIGPEGNIGFFSSADGYKFDKNENVEVFIELEDLNFKGQKVPVGFYNMISRYLPPEEEEDSYRGDPVESAVLSGIEDVYNDMRYMNLSISSIRINPYSHFGR